MQREVDPPESAHCNHSAQLVATPSATAISAPMLHDSAMAALQSTRPLCPEAPELHCPATPTLAPDSPLHETPVKPVAAQRPVSLQDVN